MIDPRRRFLVLVPHEPDLDPRIGWSLALCRAIGRTDVLATTWWSEKPAKAYDGVVALERIDATTYAAPLALKASAFLARLDGRWVTAEFKQRQGRPPQATGLNARLRHHRGALYRLLAAWGYYSIIITALYRRARAVSVHPAVLVCHDLYALIPAALLKRRFRCSILYDSHEYFPESDLLAPPWQRRAVRALERFFIRKADVVVAVSPPLADEMRRVYRLRHVIAVPNAEPRREPARTPRIDATPDPVRFLLQGQASPGRGFERLFDLWSALDTEHAVLLVRCPDGEYPQRLREQYGELFATGRADWLPAVTEAELISAAAEADVGVVPYVGPSLNHLYASPNKVSQYMHAGLALFVNELPYLASLVREFDCGVTYRAEDTAESFRTAVERLLDPDELRRLRLNALEATRIFNWERLSEPYRDALQRLYDGTRA